MSYFGKFYLVGPEATKAADWLFSADVSKAPGTGSAPRFAREITPQNPGEPRLAFPLSAEGMGSMREMLLSLSSPQSGFCLIYSGAQYFELGDEGGGSGPLAPAVAHIWSCDECWSKSSTALASCGLLSPFPRLGSSSWHFQGCKFSPSHRKGEKTSFLSPCWFRDTQDRSGQSQADDLTMGTHFPAG